MSQRSKRELIEAVRPRYLQATKAEKQMILDEFTAATGYHRKYAIRVLKHERLRCPHKPVGRRAVYRGEVVQILTQVWEIYGRICSKRLHPFLPEGVKVLERCGELHLQPETKTLLLQMSRATIDRCLRPVRFPTRHGLSTTKPGGLLKDAIPIRTFTPWDEETPGFMEIDLVAHCGESTAGQYLNTLTCTDLCTGWTEVLALRFRSQTTVQTALHTMRATLPFALRGIDSDNGSEFINDLLYGYCQTEHITFTRSRPYKKNDQAHVEQKNWSVVRHTVGYDRWETEEEYLLLTRLYQDLRLYINFFQPVLKLVAKERVDTHLKRQYDRAQTPYQRVLARQDIPLENKARLTYQYVQLNPVTLRRAIDEQVAWLWKLQKEPPFLRQRHP